MLRWLLDGTRMAQLTRDNAISRSTGYDYLHEGVAVLAAQAPGLHGALLAAKAAGYDYVLLDGTLIETDRIATPGPTAGVDLWWSTKHANHGGNIQVLTAPDGWPLWTSPVRPGREHDTTCLRTHPGRLDALATIRGDMRTLADLGYEGEADTIVVAFKKPRTRSSAASSSSSTGPTTGSARSVNAATACSRPGSKRCATSASARGRSVTSSPRPWSSSTSTNSEPPETGHYPTSRDVTRNGSIRRPESTRHASRPDLGLQRTRRPAPTREWTPTIEPTFSGARPDRPKSRDSDRQVIEKAVRSRPVCTGTLCSLIQSPCEPRFGRRRAPKLVSTASPARSKRCS